MNLTNQSLWGHVIGTDSGITTIRGYGCVATVVILFYLVTSLVSLVLLVDLRECQSLEFRLWSP